MNFCTKCQSIYSQPGTCNCYARMSPPVVPAPITVPPTMPYIGDPPPRPYGNVTITPVTSSTVSIATMHTVPCTYTH